MFERYIQFYKGAVLRGLPGVSMGTWARGQVSVQIYVHLCEARVIHLPPHMYKFTGSCCVIVDDQLAQFLQLFQGIFDETYKFFGLGFQRLTRQNVFCSIL